MTQNSWTALLLAISVFVPSGRAAQEPEAGAPRATDPVGDIFSGTVTQLSEGSLTVTRKLVGQPAVTREFVRDSGTTVEGKLRNKARVTVRYKAGDDGAFVAVHIIVR